MSGEHQIRHHPVASRGHFTHNSFFKDVIFTKHIVYDLAAIFVDDEDFPLQGLGLEMGGNGGHYFSSGSIANGIKYDWATVQWQSRYIMDSVTLALNEEH